MNIIYQTILREPRFNRTWRHARPAVITVLGKLAKAIGDKAIEAQTNKLMDAEPDEHKKQLASWRQRSPERHGSSQTVPDRIMSGYTIRANH